ncbi:MAG: succinate dehydrogenase assembly factor 2 [Alphaproteobacteria bacterium]|nr:succinate dehydrogenase assembly factor 2 [Alphaproteobacteria bacterium]
MQAEILKKKLLYRSAHRGCKEMDLMLSSFIKQNIDLFTPEELELLDDFINENELEIMKWVIEHKDIPERYHILVKKIISSKR